MYAPGDVRVEERADPEILEATDAIIRVSAACVCGSDLWPYRGVEDLQWSAPIGHEYAGTVEEVGAEVQTINRASSWSARSGPPTTPARSAAPATRAPASTGYPWAPSAPRLTGCASRSPTAPSSPPPISPPTTSSRACCRP